MGSKKSTSKTTTTTTASTTTTTTKTKSQIQKKLDFPWIKPGATTKKVNNSNLLLNKRIRHRSNSSLPLNIKLIIIWGKMSLAKLNSRIYNTSFFNLSKNKLSSEQSFILGLGIKFIPSPKPFNTFHYEKYLDKFIRNCRLFYYFGDNSNFNYNNFRIPNINFNPPPAPPDIEQIFINLKQIFLEHNEYLTSSPLIINYYKPNLSKKNWKNLISLMNNQEIIIKPADKNLGLVVMDKSDYVSNCLKILRSKDFIELNQLEATQCLMLATSKFQQILKKEKISNKFYDYFTIFCNNSFNNFYGLPKMHKAILSFRPIIAGCKYVFQIFAKFIAKLFNNFMFSHKLFLKNSNTLVPLLELINFKNSQEAFIITGDVESLYPSIPIKDCLKSVSFYINQILFASKMDNPFSPGAILELISLFLNNNYIRFFDYYFKQVNGIAMGNAASVQLANIFMFFIEKELPFSQYIVLHKRYIDDIIIVWNGPFADLSSFLSLYQKLHPNIRINFKISSCNQFNEFLDLKLQIINSKIQISTHQKILNKYLYIPNNSYHSHFQKRGFIIGELIRYVRNSSNALLFQITKNLFFERLRARGYKVSFLLKIFNSVNYSIQLRDKLLFPQNQSNLNSRRPLVLGIPHNPNLQITLREILTLTLLNQGSLSNLQIDFLSRFIVVKYKNSSIYNLLVKSSTPATKPSILPPLPEALVTAKVNKTILHYFGIPTSH
jgi:hypothetical protein